MVINQLFTSHTVGDLAYNPIHFKSQLISINLKKEKYDHIIPKTSKTFKKTCNQTIQNIQKGEVR